MKEILKNIYLIQFNLSYKDFNGTTNILIYVGDRFIFICDTFIYPEKMRELRNYLVNKFPDKKLIILNSHEDFDHFWGNSAFRNDLIISSTIAKEKMQTTNYEDEQKFFKKPLLVFPNITFDKRMNFPEEQVYFFYASGHTIGSASCFIKKQSLLFTGDNTEYPAPYYQADLLVQHIKTLRYYLSLNPKIIVSGHGDIQFNTKIIKDNLNFLRKIKK